MGMGYRRGSRVLKPNSPKSFGDPSLSAWITTLGMAALASLQRSASPVMARAMSTQDLLVWLKTLLFLSFQIVHATKVAMVSNPWRCALIYVRLIMWVCADCRVLVVQSRHDLHTSLSKLYLVFLSGSSTDWCLDSFQGRKWREQQYNSG